MQKEKKQVIYFPSLSSGASKSWLVANEYLTDKISSRFWDKEHTPPKYYHPYFLVSAGHNYKHETLRKDMGLEDALVIADSGGFQIATGKIKFDNDLMVRLFKWLENNGDIALNLDIPPKITFSNKFNDCLDQSIKNFKYFYEHQSGKTKYLNVLHGHSFDQMNQWYNGVKDFEFNGWALGTPTIPDMIQKMILLFSKGEFDKKNVQYIHILGATRLIEFIVLGMFQRISNELFDGRIQFCTDSSSPNLATVYGQYYMDVNWEKYSLKSLHFSRELNSEIKLPCRINCPACRDTTFKDLSTWKTPSYMKMTHHNMFMFIEIIKMIDNALNSEDYIVEQFLNSKLNMVRKSLYKIFESPNPLETMSGFMGLYNSVEKMTTEFDMTHEEHF